MAAGDKTLMHVDTTAKCKKEYWQITTDGSGDVVMQTGLARVIAVEWAWLADIGATPSVPEFVIDNDANTVTVTIANTTGIDALMSVTLIGF